MDRYDISQGLHLEGSDEGKELTLASDSVETYVKIATYLTDDEIVEIDEDANEIIFKMGGKVWNFSLIKEACQVKILTVTMRKLHDLFLSGKLIETQGESVCQEA